MSLARSALAAGGLENAIRSYVRHGYPFGIDDPGLGLGAPSHGAADADIAAARLLARKRDWAGAAEQFDRISQSRELEPADLDLWALSVECRGRPVEAIPMIARAVTQSPAARVRIDLARSFLETGDETGAAAEIAAAERSAIRIGSHRLRAMAADLRSTPDTFFRAGAFGPAVGLSPARA